MASNGESPATDGAQGGMRIDPIQFEVVRSALTQVAEEMAAALRRSAYSTNVKTRQDFSCAFFDRDCRPISQAFTQPVHLGSFVELIPTSVKTYGAENLEPGDMLVVNNPFGGGSHLNDVTVFGPVHHNGELVGYVASLAHHVDVGGGAPASIGPFQEIFQEGVIIPPVKLVKRGEMNEDVFKLLLSQIRSKRVTTGDFRAQVAANTVGARRLVDLVEKYGIADFDQYVAAVVDYTDRRTRAEIADIPDGVYGTEGFLDYDGFSDKVVNLKVEITVEGESVFFDFYGCDAQRRAPVNSTKAMTFSACAYALRALMAPDMPVNDGFYRHIKMNAKPGTVVHAIHPAPVVGGWETQVRINDMLFKAFSTGMPEKVASSTKAMMAQAGFGIIDRENGEYHCNYEALAGGYGARATSDGPDAVQQHGQNTENAPVEEVESHFPMRVSRLSLIEDSEGPGKFRGGLGMRRDYHFPDDPATFTVLSDRDIQGPQGIFGGMAGRKAFYILNPDDPEQETNELTSKCVVELKPGDTVSFQTPGGGGYGPPIERDPEAVLKDVIGEKINHQRAKDLYGVVIDPDTNTIDHSATNESRQKLTSSRNEN
ncbi:hydantoinase B/oxoprolinase family protein [Candidatus Lucifugimonas marina]|uniref:Hydantoinase B/oxoprolinase family protein n=1 Tax=Candidatus Lucifugimonas marina TaxID=3038979 RepID=A0AAJ5ZHL7_9CHLR|nr:hydantoinase B/oxoprolinase family protein [SAR202 cluster bacterium JH639]WFG38941.1 hydantoinase B/oxoprolinase family protein [SAR202 cluster bacterium JH1073]